MRRPLTAWILVFTALAASSVALAACVGDKADPAVDPTHAAPLAEAAEPTPRPSLTDWWETPDAGELDEDGFTLSSALGVMYPPFDHEIRHYALKCLDGGKLTLTVHGEFMKQLAQQGKWDGAVPPSPEVTVQGEVIPDKRSRLGRPFNNQFDDDDLSVVVTRDGNSAEYTVHCLPVDFPDVTVKHIAEPTEQMIAMALSVGTRTSPRWEIPVWSYLALLDHNGVPHWQRRIDENVPLFKVLDGEDAAFAWLRKVEHFEHPYRDRVQLDNYEVVLMDRELQDVAGVQTVGLLHTDGHDFSLTPDGNYIFLSYEPAQWDMSAYGDYRTEQATRDSVLQVVSPDGELLMEWNSWGKMPLQDCMKHRFPDDYAHINSAHMVDGNIIVSLRGCSRVLLLDGKTGETVWSVGETTQDADWYRERGLKPPIRVVGDPNGAFCGQHAANLLSGNRLLIYDNASHCLTGGDTRGHSRVVEYELDISAGEARYVREHSMFGSADVLTVSAGMVALMENGNWLISWGRQKKQEEYVDSHGRPVASLSEVDPDTGQVLASMRFTYSDLAEPTAVRAWPLSDELRRAVLAAE